MTHNYTHLLMAAALALLPTLALAESATSDAHKAPPAMGEPMRGAWKNMTTEQRQAKHDEMKANWDTLSPEQKAAKKEEMNSKWRDKWQKMTPEQQAEHKAKAKARWEKMPAEKQDKIKENMMMRRKARHMDKLKAE